MVTRESAIERYLVEKVAAAHGVAYKFTSPQRRNVPDRIVILPDRAICFVECKAVGKGVTEAQARELTRLHNLGCHVAVVNNVSDVDELIELIYLRRLNGRYKC